MQLSVGIPAYMVVDGKEIDGMIRDRTDTTAILPQRFFFAHDRSVEVYVTGSTQVFVRDTPHESN